MKFIYNHTLDNKLGFLDSGSYIMDGIISLNDHIMYYEIILMVIVTWALVAVLWKNYNISLRDISHGSVLEIVWTLIPGIVLVLIALPSFRLLYLMDDLLEPSLSVKVIGQDGQKLYVLNKIKDSSMLQKNNMIYNKFQSRSFHTNNIRSINRIGPHNIDILSLIIGSLLGDGYGNKRSGEGIRICFRQSIKHKDYLFWLHSYLHSRGYTSNLEPRKYTRYLKYTNKTYYGYEFNTYTFRSFNWIYKLFYKKGVKYISPSISNYITPFTLAVWIMDDGTWTGYGLRIATNSFTLDEVILLNSILKNKFDLNTTIQPIYIKNKYSIYIKKDSINKLKSLILPYLHTSMYYKLGL